jgi:formylglycine-generating enzyme required for sulfatase activity
MSGGIISGNTAIGASGSGGGVYNVGATVSSFTMSGSARISGNTATLDGGGVFNNAAFAMSGSAAISGNTAAKGGGVNNFGSTATFTMSGGEITADNRAPGSTAPGGNTLFNSGGTAVYDGALGSAAILGVGVSSTDLALPNTDGGSAGATIWYNWEQLRSAITGAPTNGTPVVIHISDISIPSGSSTIDIVSGQDITLAAAAGTKTITRQSGFTDAFFDVQSGGSLTLGDDAAGRTLVLDGNRANLTNASDTRWALVEVNGGALVMKNGAKLTGNSSMNNYGGGVYVSGGGTFTMDGGEISNNASDLGNSGQGGGVHVYNNNTEASTVFTMNGGTISGNQAGGRGGGVFVWANNGTASFVMKAGAIISGNTTNWGVGGGGVYLEGTGASFTMEGGTISGNTARNSGAGGGVYVAGGTFTKEPKEGATTSGTIYGGSASGGNANTAGGSNGSGHAVYAGPGKILDDDADPYHSLDSTKNSTAGGWALGYYVANWAELVVAVAAVPDSTPVTIYIEDSFDQTGGNLLNIASGKNITLTSLTARTITRTAPATLINVSGALTLAGDLTLDGGAQINPTTGAWVSGVEANNGVVYNQSTGTFTMTENAVITGGYNTSSGAGGGVHNLGTFNMEGGTIRGNVALSGGGVFTDNTTGPFTMSGGTISGNFAVYNSGNPGSGNGGGVNNSAGTTFTMSGGIIYGADATGGLANTAEKDGASLFNAGTATYGGDLGAAPILTGTYTDLALPYTVSGVGVTHALAKTWIQLVDAVTAANSTGAPRTIYIADNIAEESPSPLPAIGAAGGITLTTIDAAEKTITRSGNTALITVTALGKLTLTGSLTLDGGDVFNGTNHTGVQATAAVVSNAGALTLSGSAVIAGGYNTGGVGGGVYNSGTFTMSGGAQVPPGAGDNDVYLATDTYITLNGTLDAATAANIIHANPVSGSTRLLNGSGADLTANYQKFLYNGASEKINAEGIYADIYRTMVPVVGGTVETSHTWGSGDNYPAPVTVDSFAIGATEIVYDLWYEVYQWAVDDARGADKYTLANAGREGNDGTIGAAPTAAKYQPVTNISWRDAVVWCNAYSEKTGKTSAYSYSGNILRQSEGNSVAAGSGKADNAVVDTLADGYRLPTEAEWEFAARGGTPEVGTPWDYTYAGSNTLEDVAWTGENSSNVIHEAALKAPNTLGLYDMSGNVSDWCWDIHSSALAYPVFRGGSWSTDASYAAVSYRGNYIHYSTGDYYGFRVVCPPSE